MRTAYCSMAPLRQYCGNKVLQQYCGNAAAIAVLQQHCDNAHCKVLLQYCGNRGHCGNAFWYCRNTPIFSRCCVPTEAPSGLVICNLPRSRSPLRVASPGKPFLREVPPFLPALLRQLQNRLEIAWAINVVFTHVLPWSRPAVFVEGNFLMANQAHNVLPLFSSSSSQRWRGAPHQAVVLIM